MPQGTARPESSRPARSKEFESPAPSTSAPTPTEEVVIHVDGASRGNPGPSAYGVVMESRQGAPLAAFSKFLGQGTNNFAEYQALIAALEYALNHHYSRARVLTDSELMARQFSGQYKVRSSDLKPLHNKARELIARLQSFFIEHVPRHQNRDADKLANQALDAACGPGSEPASRGPNREASETLRALAVYREGVLRPQKNLPLTEGEEVDVEIHRRK
jgi:ribonuclease HI